MIMLNMYEVTVDLSCVPVHFQCAHITKGKGDSMELYINYSFIIGVYLQGISEILPLLWFSFKIFLGNVLPKFGFKPFLGDMWTII